MYNTPFVAKLRGVALKSVRLHFHNRCRAAGIYRYDGRGQELKAQSYLLPPRASSRADLIIKLNLVPPRTHLPLHSFSRDFTQFALAAPPTLCCCTLPQPPPFYLIHGILCFVPYYLHFLT